VIRFPCPNDRISSIDPQRHEFIVVEGEVCEFVSQVCDLTGFCDVDSERPRRVRERAISDPWAKLVREFRMREMAKLDAEPALYSSLVRPAKEAIHELSA
jgi:hypothetical protein